MACGNSKRLSFPYIFGRFNCGRYFPTLALLVGLGIGSHANAQFFTGPISGATGQTGRAAVDPGEAAFLNPAAIAHLQRYYAAADYNFGTEPKEGDSTRYGVLLTDGSPSNVFPGAFSYIRRSNDLPNGQSEKIQDFQVSIAGFVGSKLAVGASAHRMIFDPSAGSGSTHDNGTFGLLFDPVEWLGLAAVYYDAFWIGETPNVNARMTPTIALAAHLVPTERFRIRIDYLRAQRYATDRADVGFGAETFFRHDFVFRLGVFAHETADQTFATAGLGYAGPKLSVDYAYQKDVRTAEGHRHMFDLWLPF
jgi:hypothetical protein